MLFVLFYIIVIDNTENGYTEKIKVAQRRAIMSLPQTHFIFLLILLFLDFSNGTWIEETYDRKFLTRTAPSKQAWRENGKTPSS